MDKTINPETGKSIKVHGPVFMNLINKCGYHYDEQSNLLLKQDLVQDAIEEAKEIAPIPVKKVLATPIKKPQKDIPVQKDPHEEIRKEIGKKLCKLSDWTPEYMVHISDVHIPINLHRNGRMDEFQTVFNRLYESITTLQLNKKIAIVITGDLIHTKIKLEPDTIILARDFLLNLSNMAPTILICGNHDMSEANLDETCTLSAVCHNLSNNLYYLQKTGLYQMGNVVFALSSLKDAIFLQHSDIEPSLIGDMPVIKLYHGFLLGATTDTGYGIEGDDCASSSQQSQTVHVGSRYRKPSDFEGYHMVLLGDVHKHQSLRKDNSMAYAGSLLQLDMSESRTHGFLFWDIQSRDYTFHEIHNDYAFVKITIKDGEIQPVDPDSIPSKPTFICNLESTTMNQFDQVKSLLQSTYKAHGIRLYNRLSHKHNLMSLATPNQIKLITVDDECNIMKKINKNNNLISDLIKLHIEINNKNSVQTNVNSYSWDILSVEFKNIFSYGGERINRIDFNTGITNINAPNRHGKSSICNIILFALFHRTNYDKNSHMGVLNNFSTTGFIKLIFRHNGKRYLIKKEINNTTINTSFYEIDQTNKLVNINAVNKKDTCTLISSYVGSFEDFVIANTMISRLNDSLVYKKPTDRFQYLSRLFQLEKYSGFAKHVSALNHTVTDELKAVQKDYYALKKVESIDPDALLLTITGITGSINLITSELVIISTRLASNKHTSDDLNAQLVEYRRKLEKLDALPMRTPEELTVELESLKDNLKDRLSPSQSIDVIQHRLTELENIDASDLSDLDTLIAQSRELLETQPPPTKEALTQEYATLTCTINTNKGKLQLLMSQINKLNINNYKNNNKNYINLSLSELNQQVISKQKEKIHISESKDVIQNKIQTCKKDLLVAPTIDKSITEIQNEINDLNVQIKSLQMTIVKQSTVGKPYANSVNVGKGGITELEFRIQELESSIAELEDTPVLEKEYLIKDLTTQEQKVSDLSAKIVEKNKTANHINLNSIINYLNSLQTVNNHCTITADYKKVITNALVLANSGIFKEISDLENAKKNTESLVTEIQRCMDHNKQVKLLMEKNKSTTEYNDQIYFSVTKLKNRIIELRIEDLKLHITVLQAIIGHIKSQEEIKKLENLLLICDNNTQLDHEIHELQEYLEWKKHNELKAESEWCAKIIKGCEVKMDNIIKDLEWYNDYESCMENINTIQEYNRLTDELQTAEWMKSIEEIEEQLLLWKIHSHNNLLEAQIESVQYELDFLKPTIEADSEKISQIRCEIVKLEAERKAIQSKLDEYNTDLKQRQTLSDQINDLERQIMLYDSYVELMGKKGLPAVIIRNNLPIFENMVNDLFYRYTDYRLKLEVNESNSELSLSIEYTNNGQTTYLNHHRLSGVENALLNIAVKNTCNKLGPWGRSSLFIIDESLDCLDKQHWQTNLSDIFQLLKMDYLNIIFISHRSIPDGLVENQIRLSKNAGISSIDN